MSKPNPFVEVFMSLVKWFLIVLLVNNLIWAVILYVVINRENKEIYVRRMNNDGNIELEQYTLSVGKKEKTDIQEVLERLNVIEKKLEAKDEQTDLFRFGYGF